MLEHINASLPDDTEDSDDRKIENSKQGKTKTKEDNIIIGLTRMANQCAQSHTQTLKQKMIHTKMQQQKVVPILLLEHTIK